MQNRSPKPNLRYWWQSRPFAGLVCGWGLIIAVGCGIYASLYRLLVA